MFFNKANLGEKISIFKTKITLINKATIADNEKQELIIRLFSLALGIYLIRDILNPNIDKATNNSRADNNVEASPTCSEENNLALMIQKKKPKPVSTTELAINHNESLYKLSLNNFFTRS